MILHVDLDAFFATVEQRDNPRLLGKPVIVGGGGLGMRGVVSTASYEARKFGIYSGMPLFRAVKLCPQAVLVPGNFAKYEKASDQFHDICAAYTPIIEQLSLDELYMDLSRTKLLWQSSRWVAEDLQKRVKKEIGITCSVGIASQKTLAKIASGFKKPSGITEITKGDEKKFLASLPVSELPGCGRQTQKFFDKLKIKTVGDLAQMKPEHIKILLGKHGSVLWDVANVRDNSRVVPPNDAKSTPIKSGSTSRSTTFPFDSNDKGFIEGMLSYLVSRLAKDLRESTGSGRCVSVVVRTADFQTSSMQYTSSKSISTAHEIVKIARELLYKLWDGETKLRLIGTGVSISSQPTKQIQLFENVNDKWLRLEKAMDKTRNKHGFLSIGPASVLKAKGAYPSSSRGIFQKRKGFD